MNCKGKSGWHSEMHKFYSADAQWTVDSDEIDWLGKMRRALAHQPELTGHNHPQHQHD